jgi:predicted oxidoreductase
MKIDNWVVAITGQPPKHCLVGVNIHGKNVTTAGIRGRRNGKLVCNDGSVWELGEPSDDYETAFPNARVQFLANLIEVR